MTKDGISLLYVEDDPEACEFVRTALESHGFQVDVAHDTVSGLALASDREYGLLLLDVLLPDGSGFDLLRQIRSIGIESAVIFLTAQGEVNHRVEGLDLGADDYLSKPFAMAELLARIRAVVRRRLGHPSDDVLRLADLELDIQSHKVTRGGCHIDLTPKEFSLLQYLLENAGSAVSRSMITERVWGIGFGGYDNIIDVHMARLRSKVDRSFPVKLIRTIRGIGYTLEAPSDAPS